MASLLRPSAIDKNALRRLNKAKIRLYISQGMDLPQIEKALADDGKRITAQLHDSIVWETRFPEVKTLLSQGLEVEEIEEEMRKRGWVWTPNHKSKAWWEYYKDTIINLYDTLHSVDAVQKYMREKKSFRKKPRIYYEWLREWGVPTSAKKSDIGESAQSGSSTGSAGSTTPGSITGPYHQTRDGQDRAPSEILISPLSDTIMSGDGSFESVSSDSAVNFATPSYRYFNPDHSPERIPIDGFDLDNFPDSPHLDRSAIGSLRPLQNFRDPQNDMQNLHLNSPSLPRISTIGDEYLVDNLSNRSEEGEESTGYEYASGLHGSTALPSTTTIVVPLPPRVNRESPNPSQNNTGPWLSVSNGIAWPTSNVDQPLPGHFPSSRHDSAVEIETGLTRSSAIDTLHLLQQIGGFRNILTQSSDSYDWEPQKIILRSIPCNNNHQVIGLNYHCCGSSPLQDLALFAQGFTSHEVHRLLREYMREGAKPFDTAGNTFLHKLAILGAPWEYFEAAINAQIDPCHRNAYGQTFAHVLNISALHDNLMECLSLIRNRGIDFSQRDASGWTVLHCLFSQSIPPQTAKEILRLVESPSRDLYRRDVLGRTPRELYKHSFRQQASASPRWDSIELQLQNLGLFNDIGPLRLEDEDVDWQGDINSSPEIRVNLQNQYQEVIKNAMDDIVVEAVDGSNAFHAQAGLITAQEASFDVGRIQKFISVGIDANDYDDRGRTPLEAIITQSQDYENELIKSGKVALLIEKGGASVHSRNRLGHTPLYSAAIRGLDRTVEVLLNRESHVNIRANDNVSLLEAVQDSFKKALAEYKMSQFEKNYYEAQCSRIEACKDLLERYGAVADPEPAQFMGYAFKFLRYADN